MRDSSHFSTLSVFPRVVRLIQWPVFAGTLVLLACMGLLRVVDVGPAGSTLLGLAGVLLGIHLTSKFILPAFIKVRSTISPQVHLRTLLIGYSLLGLLLGKAAMETRRLHDQWRIYSVARVHGGNVALGESRAPNWVFEKFGNYAHVSLRPLECVYFERPTRETLASDLAGLSIEELDFCPGARLRDSQLAELSGSLPQLRRLQINCPSVSDRGVRSLAKLSNLAHLDLALTGITDEGVSYLNKLPHLTHLNLSQTLITDGATQHLAKLQHLKQLHLAGAMLTNRSLHELRMALPQATIIGPDGRALAPKLTQRN